MRCTVLRVRAVLRGILFDDFHENRVEEKYKTIVGQAGLQGTCFCITGPVTPIDNRPGSSDADRLSAVRLTLLNLETRNGA